MLLCKGYETPTCGSIDRVRHSSTASTAKHTPGRMRAGTVDMSLIKRLACLVPILCRGPPHLSKLVPNQDDLPPQY